MTGNACLMTPVAVVRGAVMSVPDPHAAPLTYPGHVPDQAALLLLGGDLLGVTPSGLPLGRRGRCR